ncbi:UDP-glucose 4-epimerase GalE [Candidatus Stoquefichus massiliensis]|uniref:UDP-glucose 4-epimerase GalE n=1 Tax=Candidatus Stoquefichus massiliensis TaxID=1470350 RepID=UPI00048A0BCE|nr:UDP-glucose 4-epimerase GalE [Candidatus Stoquefichus massiliensis]
MRILVAGGAGYIGSHICVELLEAGYEVVVIDDFSNSRPEVLGYIKEITGKDVKFYEFNILDEEKTEGVFKENKLDAVIHCAAFKAVGESVSKPIEYYTNNLMTTLIMTKMMTKYHVNNIVFSSSATVYGDPKVVPLTENCPLGETTNPYGTSKAMMERILTDVQFANPEMSVTLLRYFNPIGAHASGLIGENPKGIPNNLMPYIMKVATGELPCLGVFGDDYDTPDGTGVRDYIHVVDLAKGHVLAIEKYQEPGVHICNLGTGTGYSVLDIVHAFEKVNGIEVKYEIKPRRPGDIATCYADPTRAKEELGWVAEKTLEDMCRDTWNFAKKHQ